MIFIDRAIPRSVADALKAVRRGDVMWLEDRFPHDTKDEDWLPAVGDDGWLVVARDKKMRTRPGERDAIIKHSVGMSFSCKALTGHKVGLLQADGKVPGRNGASILGDSETVHLPD